MSEKKLFLSDEDKSQIYVGFSKRELPHRCLKGDSKYYLILMYLRKHIQVFGDVHFTLYDLLEECGYSTKTHNDIVYTDLRRIIKDEILDKGYAISTDDISTIKPKGLYKMKIIDSSLFTSLNGSFVPITIEEFEKITSIPDVHINRATLFTVYIFIKEHIFLELTESHVARISYPSKNKIRDALDVSSTSTIEKAIAILEQSKMIYVRRDVYIQDKNNENRFVRANNVYALNEEDLENAAIITELESTYGRKILIKEPDNINV